MKKPSHGTWIVAGLGAALLIAVGGFAISQLPPPVTGGAADSAQGSSASHSGSPDAPSAGSTGSGSSGSSGGSGARSGAGAPKNPPPSAGKRYTTEVVPAKPATGPALPPTTALPSPVNAPLPATASATGKLVAGFPSASLPAAPGSTVSSSSVASQDGHLQVSLVAKSKQGVTDILGFYRTALAKYGMYDAPAPATAGSTAVAFSRGGNSVTVTATPGSGGTSYVLYGVFTVTS